MSDNKTLSWSWVEENTLEDQATRAARERAIELNAQPVSPATGAALRLLAASSGAKTVIEIGTGAGVSGLWLLQGMTVDGVFTSIDTEAEYLQAARTAFREAGVPHSRTRLINGRGLDVLPRMTAAGYDMVVIDADVRNLPAYVEHARRIVRRGGLVVIVGSLWHDRVSDPARRDEETVTMRSVVTALSEDESLIVSTLTCGDGLTAAVVL